MKFPFDYETHHEAEYNASRMKHLYNLVERACKSEENRFGYGIWKSHILLVVQYAKRLARELGADEEVCEIAALMHDYAGILSYDLYENHHAFGARIAHEVLGRMEYHKDKIEEIKHCILAHRASRLIPRKSREADIVASADAIAHILAWESLLDLAVYEYKYPEELAREWVSRKLERSFAKIMPEAIGLVEGKYKLIQATLRSAAVVG